MKPILAAWEGLIGLVIFGAISLFSLLTKAKENQPVRNPAKAPIRPGGDVANELNRFFEAARQRALEAAQPAQKPKPEPEPVLNPFEQAQPRKKKKTVPRPAVRSNQEFVVPVAKPVVVAQSADMETIPVPEPKIKEAFRQINNSSTKVAPALVKARELLTDKQSVRTAFILKEILGPPKCQTGMKRL
jgi:hypothetical protein